MDTQTSPAPGTAGTINPALFIDSTLREKAIEHIFIAELLWCQWRAGHRDIEVLRAEVDRGGYDLVLESGGIIRHVQLKSSHRDGKATEVPVNIKLGEKPSGCIIWVRFDQHTLELGPFLWFGGKPGEKLPDLGHKIARHTKGNRDGVKTERPNIRSVKRSAFMPLTTMERVAEALFGRIYHPEIVIT